MQDEMLATLQYFDISYLEACEKPQEILITEEADTRIRTFIKKADEEKHTEKNKEERANCKTVQELLTRVVPENCHQTKAATENTGKENR